MTTEVERYSALARRAAQSRDWRAVGDLAREILRHDEGSAEGYFLQGLVEKAAQRPARAADQFARALDLDPGRYDAAVELANQFSIARRNAEAAKLLARYEARLQNSPRYLDLAATVYTEIGLPERAWPLYVKANELQPGVPFLQGNMAACAVYVGQLDEARRIYRALLDQRPDHQRNHYYLSRLGRAGDAGHVDEMQRVLAANGLPPEKNVFLYYAIGKELEDLGRWEEAFDYYRQAGEAVSRVKTYDVSEDVALIDKIIQVCDADWVAAPQGRVPAPAEQPTPIFIVGLPRTGTTLTERILASHSQVASLGETMFLQMVLRRVSGVESVENMTPVMIEAAAGRDIGLVASGYMDAVAYRLGDAPYFIDKLPFNFNYLGFIARAWPEARLVHLRRSPMDACFSMYKQVFTWAYRFSYDLDSLARYYIAYDRLLRHWRTVLGERLVEVEYESLVADQERETRLLLDRLGLPFEPACLEFEKNEAASATASSVQVREKVHTRSVARWRRFEQQLRPLVDRLEAAGIEVE